MERRLPSFQTGPTVVCCPHDVLFAQLLLLFADSWLFCRCSSSRLAHMTSVHAPLKPMANGTRATVLPTRPPPPVQMLSSKTSTPAARSCILCRGNLSANSTLRWCELCRQKQGEHPKLMGRGPRPTQAHGSSGFIPFIPNTGTPATQIPTLHADTDVVMVDATGGPSTSASASKSNRGATKRKVDVMDSEDLVAEDRAREDAALVSAQPKEYQTGKDLLDGLSKDIETSRASRATSSRTQSVNFHGSYTIVMDPEVRGERRVKRVVDELRQSTKLRFGCVLSLPLPLCPALCLYARIQHPRQAREEKVVRGPCAHVLVCLRSATQTSPGTHPLGRRPRRATKPHAEHSRGLARTVTVQGGARRRGAAAPSSRMWRDDHRVRSYRLHASALGHGGQRAEDRRGCETPWRRFQACPSVVCLKPVTYIYYLTGARTKLSTQ